MTRSKKQVNVRGGTVTKAVESIRALIFEGRLLPGEHIRQEALAENLGMSRIPVREALKVLQVEGLVSHSPNAGFNVVRFNQEHLVQIYTMRDHLEGELLRSIVPPDASVYAELELLNTQFSEAVEAGEIGRLNALNRSFHSRILSLAGKDLILEEVLRLWDMSGFYRSFYAYMLHADNRPAGRKLVEEHEAMLAALHAGDTERLVALSTEHRHSTRDGILRIVRPMGSFAYSPPVMS